MGKYQGSPYSSRGEGISFQGPGEDEMKEQQRVDPELAWVIRWRETGEEPTEGELFIGDSRSKYYWINREVLSWKKGSYGEKGMRGSQQGGWSQRCTGNKLGSFVMIPP